MSYVLIRPVGQTLKAATAGMLHCNFSSGGCSQLWAVPKALIAAGRILHKRWAHDVTHNILVCSSHMGSGIAGSPHGKGMSKLLTVTSSGQMRSPPLVEKFRRAKEKSLQLRTTSFHHFNSKLMHLERLFKQVRNSIFSSSVRFLLPCEMLCHV